MSGPGVGTMGIEPIADPRANPATEIGDEPKIMERTWGLDARVDASVSFEEYEYWAKIERADEMERNRQYIEKRGPLTVSKVLKNRFSHGIHSEQKKEREDAARRLQEASEGSEKDAAQARHTELTVTDEEWRVAARALKTTSWGTLFFLITTDILGWGSCPYVGIPQRSIGPIHADHLDLPSPLSATGPAPRFTSSSPWLLVLVVTSCGASTWSWTRADIQF